MFSMLTRLPVIAPTTTPTAKPARTPASKPEEEMAMAGPDQAEMDALGEKEIALALVDLDCREQTDYRERQADVQRQVEEQFIADHKAELDALVAASEQD